MHTCTERLKGPLGKGVCGEWMIPMAIIISNLSCVSQGSTLLELRVEGLDVDVGVHV